MTSDTEKNDEESLLDNISDDEEERQNTAETMKVPDEATPGSAKTLTTEEVRQGHTGDHVRYILIFSGLAVVVLLAILYFMFA